MAENIDPIKQLFDDLFTLLEAQETQTIAVMELLRDAGIASEEKMKPYLERAGNAASVKWRAARVRMEYLLTPVQKKKEGEKAEEGKEKKGAEAFWENKPEGEKKDGEKQDDSKKESGTPGKESTEKAGGPSSKPQSGNQESSAGRGGDQQGSSKPAAAKNDDKERTGSEKKEGSSKAWGPSGGDGK
jgi:hypothetical protein